MAQPATLTFPPTPDLLERVVRAAAQRAPSIDGVQAVWVRPDGQLLMLTGNDRRGVMLPRVGGFLLGVQNDAAPSLSPMLDAEYEPNRQEPPEADWRLAFRRA